MVHLAAEEPPIVPPRSMIYHRIPLLEGRENPSDRLTLAIGTVATLVRLGVSTLVCCGMGRSRSPAVAAGALAIVLGEPPDATLLRIAERRRVDVSPALWREVRAVVPRLEPFPTN